MQSLDQPQIKSLIKEIEEMQKIKRRLEIQTVQTAKGAKSPEAEFLNALLKM